jgi:hypothetical protein
MAITRQTWLPPCLCWLLILVPPAIAEEAAGSPEQVKARAASMQASYSYALEQVRIGKFHQAATALEDLLAADPDWDAGRLFYAIVLFRLGDYERAAEQFDHLAGRSLSTEQQEEATRYRALIAEHIGTGPAAAVVPVRPRPDPTPFVIASGRAAHHLPRQRPRQPGEPEQAPRAPPDSLLTGEAGFDPAAFGAPQAADYAIVTYGPLQIAPEVLQSAFGLDEEPSGDAAAAGLTARFRLADGLAVVAGAGVLQEPEPSLDTWLHGTASAWTASAGAGLRWSDGDVASVEATASYILASGGEEDASHGLQVQATGVRYLGMGQFLLGEVWYRDIQFDGEISVPGRTFAGVERYGVRIVYGVPLGTALAMLRLGLPAGFGDIDVQVAGTYEAGDNKRIDNAPNRGGAELVLKKKVAF